jgi:hypothetical protein
MRKQILRLATLSALLVATGSHAQEYPIMDKIAAKVIARYQSATCEDLWQKKGQPPTAEEQRAIEILRGDPQMQQAFFDKVAGPIVSRMFQCGMIP